MSSNDNKERKSKVAAESAHPSTATNSQSSTSIQNIPHPPSPISSIKSVYTNQTPSYDESIDERQMQETKRYKERRQMQDQHGTSRNIPAEDENATTLLRMQTLRFHNVDPTKRKKRKTVKITKADIEKYYQTHSVEQTCQLLGVSFEKLRVAFVLSTRFFQSHFIPSYLCISDF